ncbi:MAG: thioredoxin family protein [Acidobacteriales bacterium]|nr:thioredoxin family protein [Terriglobales bacterium]MCI0540166.1 thioredoxin family protein [Verrucomicrobiales bacterium]
MLPKIKMELYRWAGSLGPFRITSDCIECDFAVAAIHEVMAAHPDWPVELEIKPWLNHAWEALRHGGWHAPVLLVNGRLATQGRVPTRAELEQAIAQAPPSRPGFWRRVKARILPAPS